MKHSRSSLLLMEMIICIFFFALCAVVCSQIFAQSHLLSKKTVAENQASIVLSSLSESFYASNGNLDAIAGYYEEYAVTDNNSIRLYFDSSYNYIDKNNIASVTCCYVAELVISPSTGNSTTENPIAEKDAVGKTTVKKHTIEGIATYYSTDTNITEAIYSINLVVNAPLTVND